MQRIFDEVINRGNLDAADDLLDPGFVDHGPMGELQGVDAFKKMIGMWRAAVPDLHCTVEELFSAGDMVAWLVRTTGTHTGEMMGMPASGNRIELLSPNIGRARDCRAVEHWADQSMFQFLQQIGALPEPSAGVGG
jgi:predicted ester cyclase